MTSFSEPSSAAATLLDCDPLVVALVRALRSLERTAAEAGDEEQVEDRDEAA